MSVTPNLSAATPDPRRWKALAVLAVAQFMVILDASIVNVALPSIKTALGFSEGSLPWVVSAYVIFGVGFGLVNAPITNTAVSGMPRARAGLAAAIASTSRQVGASMGVAIGGTIAQARGAGASDLAHAMHPFFWLAAGGGVVVVALGLLSNGAWGQATLRRAAALIDDGDAPVAGVAR